MSSSANQSTTSSAVELNGEPCFSSTPKMMRKRPSRSELVHQRDTELQEKESHILRLTAALSAYVEDPNILDKLIVKAQQLSNLLVERDRMCQALKRRVVALDAKIHDMAASGFDPAFKPSASCSTIGILQHKVDQLTSELNVKDEQLADLKDVLGAKEKEVNIYREIVERSSKYRALLEERDVMTRNLLNRVSELEAAKLSMVPRCDYDAICRRKRKAEEENQDLRRQIKKLKAENDELRNRVDL